MELSSSDENVKSDRGVEESENISTDGDRLFEFPCEQCCHEKIKLLFEAAKQGNTARVRTLIESTDVGHRDAFVNETDEDGKTTLYYASSRGHVSLSKYLIEETNVNLTHKYDSTRDTVLHLLARIPEELAGLVETVKLLSSSNLVNARNNCDKTPLHCAAEFAPNSIFECLLNAERADIFAVDDHEETILHALVKSCIEGKNQFVNKLISRGTSIEARTKHELTPFLVACAFGTRTMCEFLIAEMRVDIHAVDYKNSTALHKLVLNENEDIVEIAKLLISKDLSIEARDEDGSTPLLVACSYGTRAICLYLITELRADIHAVGHKKRTALHRLTGNRNENIVDVVELLVSKGLSREARDEDGLTPFLDACAFGTREYCKYLIEELRADIRAVYYKQRTALHSLAHNENENVIDIAELLISNGLSIEARDEDGLTPFLAACIFGTRKFCLYLITELRADIRAVCYKNRTALHKLASNKNENIVDIVELLVSKGLSVEARDKYGYTPFLTACAFGTRTFCEYFIAELRADILALGYRKRTALHSLARNRNEDVVAIVKLLISKSLSIEARDEGGFTPFLSACAFGTRTFCEYLIAELRADIRAVDYRNRTALHSLAQNRNENVVDIVKLLISKGLSIEARDKDGFTPLLTACAFGTTAFCEYLIAELRADIRAVDYRNRTALHHLKLNRNENDVDIERLLISKGVRR